MFLFYLFSATKMFFNVKRLTDTAQIPTRQTEFSAGYDLYADEETIINPGCRKLISTNISVEFSEECYIRIAARSGLSIKGIDVGAGVIDSDYRGNIKVLIINNGFVNFEIKQGDRIAQAILTPCHTPDIKVVSELSNTSRGDNGFGSTG